MLAVHHAIMGIERQLPRLRGYVVFYLAGKPRQWVKWRLALGMSHLEMQVRATRRTGIAARGHTHTAVNGYCAGRQQGIYGKALAFVLHLPHTVGNERSERQQMPVDRRVTRRMCYIQSITVSPRRDGNTRHIAAVGRKNRQAGTSLRLEVETRMEMIGT